MRDLRPTNQEATHGVNARAETRPWRIPELTIYITDSCSMSCQGCITSNNLALGGHLRLEDARQRMDVWARLVQVEHLYVIGGEPMSHPDLAAWITYLDKAFDSPRKTIVTNGHGIDSRTQEVATWLELGWDFEISSHSQEDFTRATEWWRALSVELLDITATERQVTEDGLTDYYSDSEGQPLMQIGVRTEFYAPSYDVVEGEIVWRELTNPMAAHRACPAKACTHLVNGVMYRCPVQATVPRLAQKFNIQGRAGELAQRDLGYDPLAQNSRSLSTWMNTLGAVSEQCRLCKWPRTRETMPNPGLKKIKLHPRVNPGSPATVQDTDSSPVDVEH